MTTLYKIHVVRSIRSLPAVGMTGSSSGFGEGSRGVSHYNFIIHQTADRNAPASLPC